ncbi:uncharacterized protein [Clytia hemisphaerica]|uniref:Major facilitator superfamily (MFS) profile domain-containing protein n=1 Tax=Clytia hemisphaerica TaxID=252671 RepID=A0A7M5X282_9CNID
MKKVFFDSTKQRAFILWPQKMSVKKYVIRKTREILYTDVFQLKKRLLIMSFVLRYFMMGVEYSIILPTALLYMKTFNAGPFMTGLTIAAYPVAACISLPICGYFYDSTKRVKELLLILNGFEILGNLIYALPFSMLLPLLGRFIAGIGDGFLALTVGELTYLYEEKHRLGVITLLEFGRVLGLIVGPSFNFLIEGKRVQFDTWVLDNNTLPGVIMAIAWLVMEVITIFCVFNLAKQLIDVKMENKDEFDEIEDSVSLLPREKAEQEVPFDGSSDSLFDSPGDTEMSPENPFDDMESELSKSSSNSSLVTPEQDAIEEIGQGVFHEKQREFADYWQSLKEILCVEFLLITTADFMLWFCQTNFEILAPYITEFDYGWTPQLTGMIYVVGGVLVIMVFLLMYFLSAKCSVKDAHLLVVSLGMTQISLLFLIYESTLHELMARQLVFTAIAVCVFISIPLNLVCSRSLLSKLFHPDKMGIVQGLSSAIARITMILGPILGGYIFKGRIIYGTITSVFVFITTIGFIPGIKRIHQREERLRDELRVKRHK